MDGESLRKRGKESHGATDPVSTRSGYKPEIGTDPRIPKYTIDLSLEPAKRYEHVARDFKDLAADLPVLFDELVRECLPSLSVGKIKQFARFALRRLYSNEEDEELRGIAQITGIEMWLLVAFNVLLDLFMGCTSGGVRVEHTGVKSRMLHFRTLDWGMDPLRNIIVHLDFAMDTRGEIVASSIGYYGYVGILTGVRKGLSMSLNFRPYHNQIGRLANFRFYLHIALVLLGFRPSISSILRSCLLPTRAVAGVSSVKAQSLASIEQTLPSMATTAAYLTFSDGDRTIVIEKDNGTAVIRSADDFITVTNHDVAEEDLPRSPVTISPDSMPLGKMGMDEIVEESMSRKTVVVRQWENSLEKSARSSSKRPQRQRKSLDAKRIAVWMNEYPIANEETHFATVMDPKAGKVIWEKRYLDTPHEF